jgi:hypothetical protein
MKKPYTTPQTEVLQLASEELMNNVSGTMGGSATTPAHARDLFGNDFEDIE